MDCSPWIAERGVTLLTTRRPIDLDGNKQNTVTLSERLRRRGLISSTYGTSEQFFVGINAGEWVAACVASIAGAAKSQSLGNRRIVRRPAQHRRRPGQWRYRGAL
jgi:hypothetical protein